MKSTNSRQTKQSQNNNNNEQMRQSLKSAASSRMSLSRPSTSASVRSASPSVPTALQRHQPSSPPSSPTTPEWIKSHPLEGDGVLINFYQYLYKRNKEYSTCNVRIPHSVIYEHNFPRDWFSYDEKGQEIKKAAGKDLDTKKIAHEFYASDSPGTSNHNDSYSSGLTLISASSNRDELSDDELKDPEIVACYLSQTEDRSGQQESSVEFLDREELDDFLYMRPKRENGILQKFFVPKGGHNSTIQAIWSPHITRVERRSNAYKLNDARRKIKVTNYERAVTYEGPAHFSTQVLVPPQLKREVSDACDSIVRHFYATEHRRIARMVLYFKVDQENKLWLLWASCIRVKPHVPVQLGCELNLSHTFKPYRETVESNSPSRKRLQITGLHNLDSQSLEEDLKALSPLREEVKRCQDCGRVLGRARARTTHSFMRKQDPLLHEVIRTSVAVAEDVIEKSTEEEVEEVVELSDEVKEKIRQVEAILEELEDVSYVCNCHFLDSTEPFRFTLPSTVAELLHSCDQIVSNNWSEFKENAKIKALEHGAYELPFINPSATRKAFCNLLSSIQSRVNGLKNQKQKPRIRPVSISHSFKEAPATLSPIGSGRTKSRQICDSCANKKQSPTSPPLLFDAIPRPSTHMGYRENSARTESPDLSLRRAKSAHRPRSKTLPAQSKLPYLK